MSQPASNQKEPSKMNKLLNGGVDDSIKSRLPRGTKLQAPPPKPAPAPVSAAPTESAAKERRYKFLPAFWTIASVMSFTVNIVLLIVLLILLQMLGSIQLTADDQISGLLGGLYSNFVKMDQATIATNIPVDATIPLDIVVRVNTADASIRLSRDVVIPNAHVLITEGGVQINARARVTLPAGQDLFIDIDGFDLPVKADIPVHLDVPVSIPLDQTELHEPFTGLQQVVKPWYCLVEPHALINNVEVCSAASQP